MNTATQLLERCKTLAESALDNAEELLNDHLDRYGENYKPQRAAAYRAEIQEAKDILKDIEAYLAKPAEKTKVWDAEGYDALCQEFFCAKQQDCNPHPDAPHGFIRNASHAAGRYVCECEGWTPEQHAEQGPAGWTGNAKADAALVMLDRLDVSPEDDGRVDEIGQIVRYLALRRDEQVEQKPDYTANMLRNLQDKLDKASEVTGIYGGCDTPDDLADEIMRLRDQLKASQQARAQVEQEPVAYRLKNPNLDGNFDGLYCYYDLIELKKIPRELEPLYTSPQSREQVAAIKTLTHLGYTYHGGEHWKPPLGAAPQAREQEPVAWLYFDKYHGLNGWLRVCELSPREQGSFPVYAAPQAQEPIYKYKSAKTIYAKNTPIEAHHGIK
jgi:hypothetical protein